MPRTRVSAARRSAARGPRRKPGSGTRSQVQRHHGAAEHHRYSPMPFSGMPPVTLARWITATRWPSRPTTNTERPRGGPRRTVGEARLARKTPRVGDQGERQEESAGTSVGGPRGKPTFAPRGARRIRDARRRDMEVLIVAAERRIDDAMRRIGRCRMVPVHHGVRTGARSAQLSCSRSRQQSVRSAVRSRSRSGTAEAASRLADRDVLSVRQAAIQLESKQASRRAR